MKRAIFLTGTALALSSALVLAQDAPESLLPPGFENPAPAPAPPPTASRPQTPSGSTPSVSSPVVQQTPSSSGSSGGASSDGESSASSAGAPDPEALAKLPTLEQLEDMTPEELEEALGLTPQFDIPPSARRSMNQVGLIGRDEGGFAPGSIATQRASLVNAVISGNRGQLVSRWGHILLRRVLASRLDTPDSMNPADFLALRASLLLRMGEAEAARALVQDLDLDNYTSRLTDAAFNSYLATADLTGICPVMRIRGAVREDPQWATAMNICGAFRGDGRYALRQMDRAIREEEMPKVDLLLAQKYAGAAGKARRAVTIEWDDVTSMNPWRYGLAVAVGLEPPEKLMARAGPRYTANSAIAPMLGLESRASAADRAGGMGVLSSRAMVDLYSQIYSDPEIDGAWSERSKQLRHAYVLAAPSARLVAMQTLWNETESALARYSRQVLTAYAAGRLPVDSAVGEGLDDLVASMLAAGLERNALKWADVADEGSEAWALLALAAPGDTSISDGPIDTFFDDDESEELRRSAFLLAGLAGLGRISEDTRADFEDRLDIELGGETRWTRILESAVERNNPALVALLATLGMQGSSWDKMTPRYLYRIVSALRRVGMEAEARMIAAEAVARA